MSQNLFADKLQDGIDLFIVRARSLGVTNVPDFTNQVIPLLMIRFNAHIILRPAGSSQSDHELRNFTKRYLAERSRVPPASYSCD